MIVGIGLDVVEIARITRSLQTDLGGGGGGGRFEERAFTEAERRDCAGRADREQALAARFAAKEACFKALGTGWGGDAGAYLREVEVVSAPNGAPELRLSGGAASRARELKVKRLHVSLTHQPGIAAATVILEG
ncbi:MAG TPA: holo-ACP synthase [Gemmatimonadales bacterium]|nr:holo-ACP synthase [Gemmatimonadales bacterium]